VLDVPRRQLDRRKKKKLNQPNLDHQRLHVVVMVIQMTKQQLNLQNKKTKKNPHELLQEE
jgi:hypothetical protein